MTDTTPRAGLPEIAAAQSQKHVTHNEALLQMDALLCCRILDRTLSAPPGSPTDGDTYLVKATGSGAWTGQDGKIAFALDGAWRFYAPFNGLVAYVSNETKLIVYNGSSWVDYASVLALQNVPLLGVNTTADSTNKLAVASSAILLNNIGASIQAFVNKHASGDTASFLFETNFSGRAEIGLTGDDNFHFKVSPDGSTWYEGLQIDRNTGSLLLKHIDVTGTTTIGATHLGRIVRADATSGAFNVTLPASADTDDWVILRKKDSGANRVTVKNNSGTDVAWLSSQYDEAMFAWWDGAWLPVRWKIAPLSQTFTSSGSWTKPPLVARVDAIAISGGSGGGAGRRGAAGSARCGGGGGGGGPINRSQILAASLSGTETVTVGGGGSGASAISVDSTDGGSGTAGGASSFGSHVTSPSPNFGSGGTASSGAGANTIFSNFCDSPSAPSSLSTAAPNAGTASPGAGSGASGGGISTGNTAFNGGATGSASTANTAIAGASGGTAPGGTGTDGTAISTSDQMGGTGGSGGAAHSSGAGGNGGNGAAPGGGGGGGGASVNGNNSGAGGNGARGEVRVIAHF